MCVWGKEEGGGKEGSDRRQSVGRKEKGMSSGGSDDVYVM